MLEGSDSPRNSRQSLNRVDVGSSIKDVSAPSETVPKFGNA
jgi:hypothetical protein